jgi:copper chaperone CopZ
VRRSTALLAVFWMLVVANPVMAASSAGTVTTTFTVEGMHCDGCSATIKGTLERIEGVVSAEADHEAGTAVAVYDAKKVSAEELQRAIEKLGYSVKGFETAAVEE